MCVEREIGKKDKEDESSDIMSYVQGSKGCWEGRQGAASHAVKAGRKAITPNRQLHFREGPSKSTTALKPSGKRLPHAGSVVSLRVP